MKYCVGWRDLWMMKAVASWTSFEIRTSLEIFAFFSFLEVSAKFLWSFHLMSFVWLWRKSQSCSVCSALKPHKKFEQSYAFWCNFFVLNFCSSAVSQRVVLLYPQIPRIFSQNPLKNLILLGKCLQLANIKPTPTSQCPLFTLSFMNRVFRSCVKKLQFFD